jgi:hypothetical protein
LRATLSAVLRQSNFRLIDYWVSVVCQRSSRF